jgi:hypothetical protein
MKTIPSIIIIAAVAGFSLAGCEYHDYATISPKEAAPVVDVQPAEPSEPAAGSEAITPPSEEHVLEETAEADTNDPEEEAPSEEEDGSPFIVATRHEPKVFLHSSESAEDLVARLRGERTEAPASEPLVLVAKERNPAVTAILPRSSFGIEADVVVSQGSREGDLESGGSCSPALLGTPRVGAGLAATIDRSNLASYTRQSDILTGLRLGCRQTSDWDNPDEGDWNASISLEDGADTAKAPVGHALVGLTLLKCATPFGPTAQYCGAEALFRRIRGDGTVESGEPVAVRAPGNLAYFGPNSTWVNPQSERPELTAQCPGVDRVVTSLRLRRQPDVSGRGPGAVAGVEITCSQVTQN